ncbi:MAG: S8 family serine peptidase [Candidatus Poribacteria bacterium]|nr:S8 family serine peptidase [Candidatus Poribacteria bacterium]
MNQQTPYNIHSLILLIIWMISFSPAFAEVLSPEITPGELLIRLTPEAAQDLHELNAKSEIVSLYAEHKVESLKHVFPSSINSPNLQRTYLLRFPIETNLPILKKAFEDSDLIEEVAYNYLRPTLADEVVPNDPKYSKQWSLPLIRMPQTWAIEKGDKNVVIAIIDSGIDYRHEDLLDKIWVNPGEIPDNGVDDDGNGYIDDIHGWDFTDAPNLQAEGDFTEGDNEPIDETGHGTHVAGIAGAMPNNGIGIAGIAWNCPLMAVRAGLSLGGSSRLQDDDSAAAIVYAADNGANIINMSWGSAQHSFVIQDAIEYAHAQGVLLVGAAGNSKGSDSFFPAAYRRVVSVASTNQHKQLFNRSNFGASVDIGAPGNVILSTQIRDNYRTLTGTSMATPHIAGIAALMQSKRPTLTNEETRQILINTTDIVLDKDTEEPDPKLAGAGTVNAERALLASGVLQARIHAPQTNSGGSHTITFFGTAGGYKFEHWQMLYGSSTIPTSFEPITDTITAQKITEQLVVWDTTNVPEDVYTVRLVVTGRDGTQTHDQVVVTVDRTPSDITSITAIESLYGNESITIFTWATDDVTRSTFYYRHIDRISPFASIEERELGKEHSFSLGLEAGTYQFYITAQNTVGLESVNDNNGQYFTIDVVGGAISPNGFIEKEIGLSPHHYASVSADFDQDGLLELVGASLSKASTGGLTTPLSLVIYERDPSGHYRLVHSLSSNAMIADSDEILNSEIDIDTFKPWTIDDTDNDGLLEILASDKDRTFLIESVKHNSYPTQIVWETPFISVGKSADLDRDGRKEIVGIDNNNNRILIFENRGDNRYDRTAALVNETEGKNNFAQNFVIDDFNADGNIDMVFGDSEGELFIYGSTTNDSFNLEWQNDLEIDDVELLVSGDLTGDGTPELVVGGTVSPPDVPSVSPIWKFIILTYTSGKYRMLWEQAIVPYRLNGNSMVIADLDGDNNNELVLVTQPNLYVMKWDGKVFIPIYHQKVAETPTLFAADLNNNGFHEPYINLDRGMGYIESTYATDSDSVDVLTPWDVTATPLTAKVVQVTWEVAKHTQAPAVFTLYRAKGEKRKAPDNNEFEVIARNLTSDRYLDRTVETDTTYWYSVTATDEKGIETEQSEPVSVTPRTAPKILGATYLSPNWIIVTFDRQMNSTISDERRYLLRKPNQLSGLLPMSAIRDRMGTRALLAFDKQKLDSLIAVTTEQYEIAASDVADIDDNKIQVATSQVEIQRDDVKTDIKDFSQLRVYPNPVRPDFADSGAITFDRVPIGTRIQLFTPKGELLEKIDVTESDGNSKEWWLTNGNVGDVTTGIYIYLLEFETQKKVGKIAVIK